MRGASATCCSAGRGEGHGAIADERYLRRVWLKRFATFLLTENPTVTGSSLGEVGTCIAPTVERVAALVVSDNVT